MRTKKRTKSQKPTTSLNALPQVQGEMWEIGRRPLDISVADLKRKGERPELLLAVHPTERGGIVLADVITSKTPPQAISDFARRAMTQPMLGEPRRPEAIRVGTQADADELAPLLEEAHVRLEIVDILDVIDVVAEQAGQMMGAGMARDYRAQAAKAGEPLSEDGLRELYAVAKEFYERELWFDFGEDELFEIQLQPDEGGSKTYYGVVMGSMGQTMGLALYPSIEDIARVYEVERQRSGLFLEDPFDDSGTDALDQHQLQQQAQLMHDILSIPSLSLTYSHQNEVPSELRQEVKQLKLPLADKSAFPTVMKTGQGYLELALPHDLCDMILSVRSVLDWDDQVGEMDIDDEIGVTTTLRVAPVAGLMPATTVQTTLRENPLPSLEPEDEFPPEVSAFLDSFLSSSSQYPDFDEDGDVDEDEE